MREYAAVRRDEKMKKRKFDAEVCSEIFDLIMDISNEFYDRQTKKG